MIKKVKFGDLKRGDCFRLTLKGPIYMCDIEGGGQVIFGKKLGRLWVAPYIRTVMVIPAKVKISEVK